MSVNESERYPVLGVGPLDILGAYAYISMIYDGAPRQMRSVGSSPAPLSSGWGPPACLVHLCAHGCGRLSRTCTLEYSGGVAGGGGCDERHASGGTASRAGRALLIRVDGSARGSAPELGCCPRLPSCPHGLRGLPGSEPLLAGDGACRRLAWNSALSATLLRDCRTVGNLTGTVGENRGYAAPGVG